MVHIKVPKMDFRGLETILRGVFESVWDDLAKVVQIEPLLMALFLIFGYYNQKLLHTLLNFGIINQKR